MIDLKVVRMQSGIAITDKKPKAIYTIIVKRKVGRKYGVSFHRKKDVMEFIDKIEKNEGLNLISTEIVVTMQRGGLSQLQSLPPKFIKEVVARKLREEEEE